LGPDEEGLTFKDQGYWELEARHFINNIEQEFASRLYYIKGLNPKRFWALSLCKAVSCETPIFIEMVT
jgi:uncharacterized membrane protein